MQDMRPHGLDHRDYRLRIALDTQGTHRDVISNGVNDAGGKGYRNLSGQSTRRRCDTNAIDAQRGNGSSLSHGLNRVDLNDRSRHRTNVPASTASQEPGTSTEAC